MVEYNDVAEESIGARTARKGTIYVTSRLVAAGATFLLLIFLTRFMGPTEYGLYAIAAAFTNVLGMAGNFGLGTSVRKKIPESKERKRFNEIGSNAYAIAIVGSLAITLIGIGISGYIAFHVYKNAELYLPIVVASVTIFLAVIYNLSNSVLVGADKVKQAAISNIAYSFVQLIAVVALVLLGYSILGALVGLAIGLGIGIILTSIYIMNETKFNFVRPSKKVIREILGFSLPVMISNVAYVGIANLAIDILGIYVAPGVVGSFGAAYKLGRTFDVILVSSTFVLLPALSKAFADPELSKRISEIYNESVFYLIMLSMPILVFLITAAKYITHLLFSSAYQLSGLYFAFIAIGITAQVISSFAGTLIISHGETKRFMRYQLIGVGIEFILLLIFMAYLRAYGIILALFIIGPILINILYIAVLKREFKIHLNYSRLSRIFTAGIATWAIVTAINYYLRLGYAEIIIDLIAVLLIYPPIVVLAGIAKRENLVFIRKATGSIPLVGILVGAIVRYAEAVAKATK